MAVARSPLVGFSAIWTPFLRRNQRRSVMSHVPLPWSVPHADLSGGQLAFLRGRGGRGAPARRARVWGGHGVGSLPVWRNSLDVAPLYNLNNDIIYSSKVSLIFETTVDCALSLFVYNICHFGPNVYFTCKPFPKVGSPIVRAGLLLLPPFFRLLFCFSLSLFGPRKRQTNMNKNDPIIRILWHYLSPEFPEEDDLSATQLRSFLRVPSPHRQPQ